MNVVVWSVSSVVTKTMVVVVVAISAFSLSITMILVATTTSSIVEVLWTVHVLLVCCCCFWLQLCVYVMKATWGVKEELVCLRKSSSCSRWLTNLSNDVARLKCRYR